METLHINSEGELSEVVKAALQKLEERRHENAASVLALSGDLGAGKTAFVKKLARKMGVEEEITSPTFVIMKFYQTKTEIFEKLCHIDAYRVEDTDEMRVLRFSEVLQERNTLVCIEWAENIAELLPAHTLYLHIEITSEFSRAITFADHG